MNREGCVLEKLIDVYTFPISSTLLMDNSVSPYNIERQQIQCLHGLVASDVSRCHLIFNTMSHNITDDRLVQEFEVRAQLIIDYLCEFSYD